VKTPRQVEQRLKELRADARRRREALLADTDRHAWDWEKERLAIERMKGEIAALEWCLESENAQGDEVPPAEQPPETTAHDVVSPSSTSVLL
jgi:hypothetical protein